ncbi:MAG: UDP-N-acetylmuramate--L-alanine ligase, partial [Proteobacteria bacterium]|nr:UDP-N-acetylmuramate--L-alanine ligase [Pseudomonadota bacterium]
SARDLVLAMRDRGHREVEYAGERAELLQSLPAALEPRDALIFMGAGDVGSMAREFLDAE